MMEFTVTLDWGYIVSILAAATPGTATAIGLWFQIKRERREATEQQDAAYREHEKYIEGLFETIGHVKGQQESMPAQVEAVKVGLEAMRVMNDSVILMREAVTLKSEHLCARCGSDADNRKGHVNSQD